MFSRQGEIPPRPDQIGAPLKITHPAVVGAPRRALREHGEGIFMRSDGPQAHGNSSE